MLSIDHINKNCTFNFFSLNCSLLTIYKSPLSSSSNHYLLYVCTRASVAHTELCLHQQFPLFLHAPFMRYKTFSGASGKSVVFDVVLSTQTFKPNLRGLNDSLTILEFVTCYK